MEGQDNWSGWVQLCPKRERDWVEQSANEMEISTDSWINLVVAGLPSKKHNVIGQSRGSNTKVGEAARDESKNLRWLLNR